MESVKEQSSCFNFCFKVGKIASETHSMLREAYSDDAWSQMMTYKCFKRSKNGRSSAHDDDEQSGQPPATKYESLIAQLKNIVHGNRRLTEKLQKRLEYPHVIQF
jgi:hypothetical protein